MLDLKRDIHQQDFKIVDHFVKSKKMHSLEVVNLVT